MAHQYRQTSPEYVDLSSDTPSEVDRVQELTADEIAKFQRNATLRSSLPQGHRIVAKAISLTGAVLQPGVCAQYGEEGFFWVKHVVRDEHNKPYLLGLKLIKTKKVFHVVCQSQKEQTSSMFKWQPNELCMLLQQDSKQGESYQPNSYNLCDLYVDKVECIRSVVFTNQEFLKQNSSSDRSSHRKHSLQHLQDHGVLYCRWMSLEVIDVSRKKCVAWSLLRLRSGECTPGKFKSEALLVRTYGRMKHARDQQDDQRYNYADVCVGGGIGARGVKQAGFTMEWCVDSSELAIATIKTNRLFKRTYYKDIRELVSDLYHITCISDRVDWIHISYPCQPHSKANRHANPDRDDENRFIGLTLGDLIKLLRPRIVTLEQTDGILDSENGLYFRALIRHLTDNDYAVQYKVVHMEQHGVPNMRKRLFVVAACPGQKMPLWPEVTHGRAAPLKPLVTYNDAMHSIRYDVRLHNVNEQRSKYRNSPSRSWDVIDGNQPLRHCITTGGLPYHLGPEGYPPTARQLARLMSLPDRHRFPDCSAAKIIKLIGNGVPTEFMRVLGLTIKDALRETDEEVRSYEAANTVVID